MITLRFQFFLLRWTFIKENISLYIVMKTTPPIAAPSPREHDLNIPKSKLHFHTSISVSDQMAF